MAEKPTTLPEWATDVGTTVEPAAGQKAAGFAVSTRPPARWVNWLLNNLYTWMQYLNAPVGTGAGPGLEATGGATAGSGLIGVGGAGGGIGVEAAGTDGGQGVVASGDGGGSGVKGTGGATNGYGVEGIGQAAGPGVHGTGGATGPGVVGIGGATSGNGGTFQATNGNGHGVSGKGHGSGAGVYAGGSAAGTGYALKAVASHADGAGIEVESGADAATAIYAHGGGSDALIYALAAAGAGPAVYASHTGGRGLVVTGDTTSPTYAPLRIIPQDTLPTEAEVGDLCVVGAILYICTTAGVFGGTLVWTKVGTQT